MTYRVKRRGILVLIAAVLAAAVVYMERYEYNRIQRDGAYMEHLCFVMSDSMSEQKIFCFTDETEQTSYLFLPSYAKAEDVKISFNGADTVVFSGDGKETALKDGGKIGALQYDKKYEMYFCDKKGERLAGRDFVIMHSAGLPAAFLETDSGSMSSLDADKSYEEKGRIVLLDADGTVVCADKLDRISGRGNSTWGYPKKSYGIRLKTGRICLAWEAPTTGFF